VWKPSKSHAEIDGKINGKMSPTRPVEMRGKKLGRISQY